MEIKGCVRLKRSPGSAMPQAGEKIGALQKSQHRGAKSSLKEL